MPTPKGFKAISRLGLAKFAPGVVVDARGATHGFDATRVGAQPRIALEFFRLLASILTLIRTANRLVLLTLTLAGN